MITNQWLVIVTTRDDFLASGTKDKGVLELSSVTTLDVNERRVSLNCVLITEILQGHLILGAADAIQPTLAERQSAKVFVDCVEKRLAALQS